MKIDFYISSLSSGGAEHVLINLATDFAKKGHDISITTYEKRPQFYEVESQIKVNKYNNKKYNKFIELLKDFHDTKQQLKKRKSQVAISFLSRCNIMLIIAGLFSKTKLIVCDRNNLLRKYPKYVFVLSCWVYALADAVCVQTKEMKSFYPKYLQKKIHVLENPLDFDEMQKQLEKKKVEKENSIISIGRLERQKDFPTLFKAFSKVQKDFPNWDLKIYGQGERQKEFEKLIKELNLEKKIKLCGVTRVPFLEMNNAKIFVLSSFYEGFPNVLCEAMYASLPCIATSCECGPSELIDNGVNGILTTVQDIDEMAKYLEILMKSEQMRLEMGNKAQKSVLYLEKEKISDRWMTMILEILEAEGIKSVEYHEKNNEHFEK